MGSMGFNVVSWMLAGIVGSSLIACSSPAPVDDSTEESFNDEGRMFVPASPQTSAELGVAMWVTSDDEVLGLDQDGRVKTTAWFAEGRFDFYGEEHGDLPPFSEGTTAAKSLQRAAEDLRAATAAGDQGTQSGAVTSSLSPQKVWGGTGDGTGCKPVQGIGVRGTPMTKLVCPEGNPSNRPFEGCTGDDGRCPASGLICRSCGAPPPAQVAPPQAEPEENCTVRQTGPSDGAGATLVRDCPDGEGGDEPKLTNPAPVQLVSRSCTTPPKCRETLGNYYSNKMLLAQCSTADSCAYWGNMVKNDLPFVQSSGCAACFGGR